MKRSTGLLCLLAGFGLAAAQSASAQDGGAAAITTGASYSSQRGALAFIGFKGDDLFGSGVDVDLSYEAGENDAVASLAVGKSWDLGATGLGQDTSISATLSGYSSDLAAQQYAFQQGAFDLRAAASSASGLNYAVGLFAMSDEITAVGAGVSPLVSAESGKSTAVGLSFDLGLSTLDDPALPTSGYRLGGTLAIATPAGDRQWAAASVRGELAHPVGPATLALKAEAGAISGLNGQTVGILDRAFAGNDAPRGFAYGGLGPRDVDGAGVDQPLGGNRYLLSSAELRFDMPNPNLTLGVFVDSGAVWDLDVTTGGAMGAIDDSFSLRSSVGLAVYWQTPVGVLNLNLAKPIQSELYDQEEMFTVGLDVRF